MLDDIDDEDIAADSFSHQSSDFILQILFDRARALPMRLGAFHVIVQKNDMDMATVILAIIQEEDSELVYRAIYYARQLPTLPVLERLREILKTEAFSKRTRAAAIFSLARMKDEQTIAACIDLINSDDVFFHEVAITALGVIASRDCMINLEKIWALHSCLPSNQLSLALSLARSGSLASEDYLIQAINSNIRIRAEMACALAKIGNETGTMIFRELLLTNDPILSNVLRALSSDVLGIELDGLGDWKSHVASWLDNR